MHEQQDSPFLNKLFDVVIGESLTNIVPSKCGEIYSLSAYC